MDIAELSKQLTIDEGKKSKPYTDTVGKITIGVGRNLDDIGLSENEIQTLLANDINRVLRDLDSRTPWWRTLNEARQQVMANMCFNLGIGGLLGFRNTVEAIKEGRYDAASNGMRASLWYRQTGSRAERLAKRMSSGE